MKKEEIIKKLEKNLTDYEAQKEAWQQVKRNYKNDGGNFQSKNKNFVGAKFGLYAVVEDDRHPYLTICYRNKSGMYCQEHLPCFKYWDTMTAEEKENKTPTTNETILNRDTYILSYDEIEEAIKKHLNFIDEKIEDYNQQIKNVNFAVEFIDKKIKEINTFFEENEGIFKDGMYSKTLLYEVIKYIKANINSKY